MAGANKQQRDPEEKPKVELLQRLEQEQNHGRAMAMMNATKKSSAMSQVTNMLLDFGYDTSKYGHDKNLRHHHVTKYT